MGCSLWHEFEIGTVSGVISTVVVTIVWKCIKAMLKISRGQPEKLIPPSHGQEGIKQCVIHITPSNPPTSSPDSSPFNRKHNKLSSPSASPTPSFGAVASIPPSHGQEGLNSVIGNKWSSPPASPTPSFGAVASIPPSPGQEGIEQCVIDNTSSSPPPSPTPSFGPDASIRRRTRRQPGLKILNHFAKGIRHLPRQVRLMSIGIAVGIRRRRSRPHVE